jgi:hypothetical protein
MPTRGGSHDSDTTVGSVGLVGPVYRMQLHCMRDKNKSNKILIYELHILL